MAVLGRLLVSSAQRLDLPDFLSIDSYTQGDFKYLMKSFVGDDTPYVLKGFDVINPQNAIGTQNVSIRVANSVMYYPGSSAGPFFYGLEEGNLQSAPLVPELRKNATNYVYLILSTADAAKDTRAFWDPDKNGGDGGEFTQDVNTQTLLSVQVNVSVSSFPANTVPVCKVTVGANFIEDIEDARDMMFRLGSGGLVPNPLNRFAFRQDPTILYARKEPNTKMTSALDPNPFFGGDKNIHNLKEWMDVVMTKFAELGGTTYWYEDVGAFNIVNTFKDALATSLKSKGSWASSESVAGNLIWTEDITIQSTADKRDVIIRAGNRTMADNQVMFVERIRDVNINSASLPINWFNSVNHVNGPIGSFENLSKGDWIKKADDMDSFYTRVEEFYLGPNQSGGIASPGTARSIRLSETYSGTTESKQAVYTKGVYLPSDIGVTERSSLDIAEAAGNFCWLAIRSDTIMSISDISTTVLNCHIKNHDGTKAKVISPDHGLVDDQKIGIYGSTNFDGTYTIEVETSDIFYIYVSGGVYADEESVSAAYAKVITGTRSTANGLQLESANHGFKHDQMISITGTANYNSDVKIFVKSGNSFTFPVSQPIANETSGLATAVEIYVRTEIGPLKLQQGASKEVGKLETENLMAILGIDSVAATSPSYSTPSNYNTLHGYVDYNSSVTDSLIARASKLTSMMANKAQDKNISFKLNNVKTIQNSANGLARSISFIAKDGTIPTLHITQPSTRYSTNIVLNAALNLLVDQVAYVTIDRNNNTNTNIAALTISSIRQMPLDENIFIFAMRLADSTITLWDGTPIRVYSTIISNLEPEVETITVPPASSIISGQSFNTYSALDANAYYVWFNVDNAGGNPFIPGRIPVEVALTGTDTALTVASILNSTFNTLSGFSSTDNLDGTITISRTSAGKTTDSSNNDVGGSFSITVDSQGAGSPLNYISDGDLLEAAVKKLDEKLSSVENSIPDKAYEEAFDVSAPIAAFSQIFVPLDSRNGNIAKGYLVGAGQLEMFLNGQYLMRGIDWNEVGSSGSESTYIEILDDLVIGDKLIFRIDNLSTDGGITGGGGSGEANTASNVGAGVGIFQSKAGVDLQFRTIVSGAGVSITQNVNDITISSTPSTANSSVVTINGANYIMTASNDIVLAINGGNDITVTLPTAIGNLGKVLNIKKIDTGNILNIRSVFNQTLDGVNITTTPYEVVTQWESITIVSDGANWFIL